MRLKQLQQFVAIAESGSVRAAARRVGMTQPALTKALRQLEEEFGVPLFVRSVQGAALTHFGNAFLPHVKLAETALRHAAEELAQMRGGADGSLSVAVAPVVGVALLPSALRFFRRRCASTPVTVLDALFPSGPSLLRAGSVELYVGPIPPAESAKDLHVEELFANEMVVACRVGHPLANARSLAELRDAEWIFGGPLGFKGSALHKRFAEEDLKPPLSRLQCESFASLIAVVAESDLLMAIPRKMYQRTPYQSLLHAVALREKLFLPPVGIVSRAGHPSTRTSRIFVSALKQAAR